MFSALLNAPYSLIRGLVELYVPSPRSISAIKVKLRALQTVAVLDATSGQIPLNWEDSILLEKEVRTGASDSISKRYAGRGRTPIPAPNRRAASTSRPPPPLQSEDSLSGPTTLSASRRASQTPSYDEGSPNDGAFDESRSQEDTNERTGRSSSSAAVAFVRAVSRGRNPVSRAGSRATSPVHSRAPSPTRRLDSFASTSNAAALRSQSMAPAILPPSPPATPRDLSPHGDRLNSTLEGFGDDRGRSTASRTDLVASQLSESLSTSLSVGQHVERSRAASHRGGLGHPSSEQFGLRQPRSPTTTGCGLGSPAGTAVAGGMRSRGGLAKRRESSRGPEGSEVSRVTADDASSNRSSSLGGWARFGRSVSRARGIGGRDASVSSLKIEQRPEDAGGGSSSGALEGVAESSPGLDLEKGVHGFEFAFIVPANSAEYTRSPFGRVRYVIKATAYGAGRAKSNVEGWRDCFPVANPSTEGGPTPLAVLYNDVHPTVGVLSIACTSQNISVGGLFQLDIHSPIPPPDLVVYLVRVSLDTTVELRTKRKGKQKVPAQRQKLFEKGYVPPRKEDNYCSGDGKKEEGPIRDPEMHGKYSAWTVQGLARMPDDNTIRSSTIGGTRADIRFSHQLIVELVHSRESDDPSLPRKLKVFTLRQPITLPSCCVAFDAATLPAYTPASENTDARPTIDGLPYDLGQLPGGAQSMNNGQASGNTAPGSSHASLPTRPNTGRPIRGAEHDHCVCGLSLQDLETRERAMIPVDVNYDIPIENLRSCGKIGELMPTRASTSRGSRGSRSGSGSRPRRGSVESCASRPRRSVSRTFSRSNEPAAVEGTVASLVSRTRSRETRSPSLHSTRSGSIARSKAKDGFTNTPSSGANGVGGAYPGGSLLQPSSSRLAAATAIVAAPHASSSSTMASDSHPAAVDASRAAGSTQSTPMHDDQPPSYDVVLLEEGEEQEEEDDRQEERDISRGRGRRQPSMSMVRPIDQMEEH